MENALTKEQKIELLGLCADHFEDHPEKFAFLVTEIPSDGRDKCCPLGYMSYLYINYYNVEVDDMFGLQNFVKRFYNDENLTSMKFYDDMNFFSGDTNWIGDAGIAVRGLRTFAKDLEVRNGH